MTKWVLTVYSDCASLSREKEFNEWYDKIHLPDVLKIPGFRRATRYVNTDPKIESGKFLAIYEIESEDIQKTMEVVGKTVAELRGKGRWSDLLLERSLATYKQISSLPR